MTAQRNIEIFSAGCPVCRAAAKAIETQACPSCKVTVVDMNDPAVAQRANTMGIRSVPAVVIDGRLADCCAGRGPDIAALKRAGLGVAVTAGPQSGR